MSGLFALFEQALGTHAHGVRSVSFVTDFSPSSVEHLRARHEILGEFNDSNPAITDRNRNYIYVFVGAFSQALNQKLAACTWWELAEVESARALGCPPATVLNDVPGSCIAIRVASLMQIRRVK